MATPALTPTSLDESPRESSSRVRERAEARSRAERRVGEYLRALGLSDETRVQLLAESFAGEAGERADEAVALAQARVAGYWQALFGDEAESTDALWLRAFVADYPEHFLSDPEQARAAADRFGDRRTGSTPVCARFAAQQLERVRMPSWLRGLLPPLGFAALMQAGVLVQLGRDHFTLVELAWAGLFGVLFALAAIGAWTSVLGWWLGRREPEQAQAPARMTDTMTDTVTSATTELPACALLMPVYHEDAERVFAALLAMRESLLRTPGGTAFELFVLSDSRDPLLAAEEERAFRRAAALAGRTIPIYYRRRPRNERKKVGNLAEFFERFGQRYRYAAVLDADSLMSGESLCAMVRRMEAEPRVGLLQAPLALHGGSSLFARSQQLIASTSGPLLLRGLAAWSGPHGNYYGHNALVRVSAFLECCALPALAGEPPLGGDLLSHDFVEAALLCRAGHEVRTATELGGSWEELPQSLPAYVARDRRWCQGNIQHLRVAFTDGLRTMSRLHLLLGAMSYLVGPAWLVFVALGAVLAHGELRASPLGTPLSLALAAAAAGLLLIPRVLGTLATLSHSARRRAHGGALRLCASATIELVISAWLAPLFMLHHTRCVCSILLGRSVSWGAQHRSGTSSWLALARSELPASALGVSSALALGYLTPALLPWLAPVWLPLALAIPLAILVSSARAGGWLARAGLLLVPSESEPDELLLRAHELRSLTRADDAARFRDLVLDPVLLATHVQRLEQNLPTTGGRSDSAALGRLCERALRVGPAGLSLGERSLLAADAPSMRVLHREAWRTWPVETWQLARDQPHLPPAEEPA
ncbi:MAG TPA: glucans biosynthesis glucosyltransferase MdoH [Polyangiales bacterium]|nr:glucans biosynthesis glucosyltransferase MdoH [Polyangiales bacterium]